MSKKIDKQLMLLGQLSRVLIKLNAIFNSLCDCSNNSARLEMLVQIANNA
jgi:hypothetical protein